MGASSWLFVCLFVIALTYTRSGHCKHERKRSAVAGLQQSVTRRPFVALMRGLGAGGTFVLKMYLTYGIESVDWIQVAKGRVLLQAFVNTANNLHIQ